MLRNPIIAGLLGCCAHYLYVYYTHRNQNNLEDEEVPPIKKSIIFGVIVFFVMILWNKQTEIKQVVKPINVQQSFTKPINLMTKSLMKNHIPSLPPFVLQNE